MLITLEEEKKKKDWFEGDLFFNTEGDYEGRITNIVND